jgi:hypothetical protein
LKYAKQAKESFEKELKIKQEKKVPTVKISKSTPEEIEEKQKKLTNYAISLHMIGKSLKSVKKVDEGKEFLKRALHVAETILPSPNQKLIDTIKDDINDFDKEIRYLPSKRIIADPDKLLEKITNLLLNKKLERSQSTNEKLDHSQTQADRRLARSTSEERRKDDSSSKPPLGSKRYQPSKSSARKGYEVVKAEDDTELLHVSMYGEEKDFKSRQEEFIKERIKDQQVDKNIEGSILKKTDQSITKDLDSIKQARKTVKTPKDRCKYSILLMHKL